MSTAQNDENNILKEKTITGIHWRFLTTLSQAFLTFAVGVLLARILPPKDFGLIGMALIFTGLADLFSTVGMGPVIIQQRELDENTVGTAFLISIVFSTVLAAFFLLTAPIIAIFFHEPRVTSILRTLSILFIMNGFSTVSRAILTRELRFQLLFYQELISFIIGYGLLAVILALTGFGVWSLVGGVLLKALISCAIFLYFSPISPKLMFDKTKLPEILRFGTGVSINDIVNYLSSNFDRIMISRYLNPTALGLYTYAFDIIRQPQERLSNVFSSVLFPAYSRIQENKELMSRIYLKGVEIITIITFPFLTGIAVSSKYVIIGIYGTKWSGAVTVLRILCVAGMLKAVSHLAGAITHATGSIYLEVRMQAIYAFTLITFSFYGIHYGIEGIGAVVVISSLLFYLLMAHCVINILEIHWWSFFMAQKTGATLALIVAATDVFFLYFLHYLPVALSDLVILFILIFLSFLSLLFGIVFLPRSIKGDAISWILSRYRNYFPRFLFNWLYR